VEFSDTIKIEFSGTVKKGETGKRSLLTFSELYRQKKERGSISLKRLQPTRLEHDSLPQVGLTLPL